MKEYWLMILFHPEAALCHYLPQKILNRIRLSLGVKTHKMFCTPHM